MNSTPSSPVKKAQGKRALLCGLAFVGGTALLSLVGVIVADVLTPAPVVPASLPAPELPAATPSPAATPAPAPAPEALAPSEAELAAPLHAARQEALAALAPADAMPRTVKTDPAARPATPSLAPDTMEGLRITCYYKGASMREMVTDDEEELRPAVTVTPEADGTFNTESGPMDSIRDFLIFNEKTPLSAARLVVYEKVGPKGIDLRILRLMVPDEAAVSAISKVVNHINEYSVDKIREELANYLLDAEESISITLTSPTEGTATSRIESGDTVTTFTNIVVKIETDAPTVPVKVDSPHY